MHKEEDSQDSTAFGSPAYSTGLVAQAIYLDGADDYLALPNDICDSDDVTIGAWVNWDSGGARQRIFDFGVNTGHTCS